MGMEGDRERGGEKEQEGGGGGGGCWGREVGRVGGQRGWKSREGERRNNFSGTKNEHSKIRM